MNSALVDYSNLEDVSKRESLMYQIITDKTYEKVSDEMISWTYGDDFRKMSREDFGGFTAILSFCLWHLDGYREQALTMAEISYENYGSNLGQIILLGMRMRVPQEAFEKVVIDYFEKGITE